MFGSVREGEACGGGGGPSQAFASPQQSPRSAPSLRRRRSNSAGGRRRKVTTEEASQSARETSSCALQFDTEKYITTRATWFAGRRLKQVQLSDVRKDYVLLSKFFIRVFTMGSILNFQVAIVGVRFNEINFTY